LQESVKVGHAGNSEHLEQPKIDIKKAMTFHNGEQNELEDTIQYTKPKIVRPIGNHPLE
jgi:hypothetical protein